MKRLLAVALLFAAVLPSSGAKKEPVWMRQLVAEFQGHFFVTKIRMASHAIVYHEKYGRNMARLIDTEISSDGNVQYFVRRGYAGGYDVFEPGTYIQATSDFRGFVTGSTLYCTKVELKDDRIELWMSSVQGDPSPEEYAKLKVMLGRGFETMDYDQIVTSIGRAFRIDRVEALLKLNEDYSKLQHQLDATQKNYEFTPADNAIGKLETAKAYSAVLRSLVTNRKGLAAFGKQDTESATYQAKLEALEKESSRYEEAAQKQRVKLFEEAAQKDRATASALKSAVLQKKVLSEADYQEKKRMIDDLQAALSALRLDYDRLAMTGRVVAAVDTAKLKADVGETEAMQQALERERAKVAQLELDNQYRALDRKKAQLQDAYLRSFGTSQESTVVASIADVLRQMIENRRQAERAGSRTAGAKASELERELKKY